MIGRRASMGGQERVLPNVDESNWAGPYNAVVDALYRFLLQSGGSNSAAFLKSSTANPASAGFARLANADALTFRGAAGADSALVANSSDRLAYLGAAVSAHPSLVVTSSNAPVVAAAFATINFNNTVSDPFGGYAAGVYTIPTGLGGYYLITGRLNMNVAAPGAVSFQVRLFDGTTALRQAVLTTSAVNNVQLPNIWWAWVYGPVTAGTALRIQAQYTGGASALTAIAGDNGWSLRRIRET